MKPVLRVFAVILFGFSTFSCAKPSETAESFESHWQDLYFTQKKTEQAQTFCERWLQNTDAALRTQARICLASLAVYNNTDSGFETARAYIQDGLKDTANDLNLHLLRLNLDVYYQKDLSADLNATLQAFPNTPAEEWLPPLDAWFKMQEFAAIQSYLTILNEHFPQNPDVIGHLGMIHFFQGDLENAQTLLQNGLALNPENVSLMWNLARLYEIQNQNSKAHDLYEKAIGLVPADDESAGAMHCLYAEFLFEKMKDSKNACDAARFHCGEFFEKYCQSAP